MKRKELLFDPNGFFLDIWSHLIFNPLVVREQYIYNQRKEGRVLI